MPIRIQLLLFGLLGNILIAGVLYYASDQRASVEQEASGESYWCFMNQPGIKLITVP